MIGLVDWDLQTSSNTKTLIPNLEIMKLATYYRSEENIFCRLVELDETELSGYEKIYFFSEADDAPNIPQAFLRANNIVYGGTAFTKGVYIPFENEIIDFTLPRPTIYKDFLKKKYQEGVKTKVIEHALDDTYYRMYAGQNQLPIPKILQKKRVYLYDKEFFYPNWKEIIEEISNRRPSTIIRVHPIICKTISQYFDLREQAKIARTNEIILDINIPLTDVGYMLRKYKNLFLADITSNSNIYITLGGNYPSSYHYFNDLIYKLNLLYSFWSAGIEIKIKYEKPPIGVNNPLENLSLIIETWAHGALKNKNTINKKIPKKKRKKDDDTIEEKEKLLLLKFHPSAKDLFDQTFEGLKKGGYWRV